MYAGSNVVLGAGSSRCAVLATSVRFKTAKFKPKIAKNRPLKTPSAVALDHFDFYYGPMFGESKWPSIRLGLLSPNKYIAIVNTLSKTWEANDALLADLGTTDLMKRIIGPTASERIEERKKRVDGAARRADQDEAEEAAALLREDSHAEYNPSLSDRLSAATLSEFAPSPGSISIGELHLGKKKGDKRNQDFEVTGFEGTGSRLPVRPHFIYYPRELRVRTYDRGSFADYPPPMMDSQKVPSWWLLDGGSIVPILALGIQEGDSVLDVCAAPGGKSLAILLTGLPSKLVCNDAKMARLGQLKRALSTYVPSEHPSGVADKVILKRKDATDVRSWDEIGCYDKVLADVPCSTDRLSVTQDEGNMFAAQHSNDRLGLPEKQTKILVNSIRSLCVGGSVVYSTCTMATSQNEAVVENAAAIVEQRYGIKVVEESLSSLRDHLTSSGLFRFSDACQRGALVLPFLPSNFGPMYVCKLTRTQ